MKAIVCVLALFAVALLCLPAHAGGGCAVGTCGGNQTFAVVQAAPYASTFQVQSGLQFFQPQVVVQSGGFHRQAVVVQNARVFRAQPQVNVQVQNRGLFGGRGLFGRQRVNVQVR
jgi:hypothetical protein